MTGVLKGKGVRGKRLGNFGYITEEFLNDTILGEKGTQIKGHEFHYWDSTDNGNDCLAVKPDGKRSWECVHMEGNLFAGFPHLHFYSNPSFAERFVERCRSWKCRNREEC